MTQKRNLKIVSSVFVVLLISYLAWSLSSYYSNTTQINQEISLNSQTNLNVINSLTDIETHLYVHHKSVEQYLNTGDFDVLNYVRIAEDKITRQLKSLESFNKEEFPLWVEMSEVQMANTREELKTQIQTFNNSGRTLLSAGNMNGIVSHESFQLFFYLIKHNIKLYFDRSQGLISLYNEGKNVAKETSLIQDEGNYISLLYTGLKQLASSYNDYFWGATHLKNSTYQRNVSLSFFGLMLGAVLLILFGFFIGLRLFKYLHSQLKRDEKLVLLDARDLVTGLFNEESFGIFGGQELERARRQGYPITVLLFKIDSYSQIKSEFGNAEADRFIFQVATVLRKTCRSYEGVYRYTENTFVMLMTQADSNNLYAIMNRFRENVFEHEFFVKDDQTKMKPTVSIGHAFYPSDGESVDDLIQAASANIKDQEGKILPPEKAVAQKESAKIELKAKEAFPEEKALNENSSSKSLSEINNEFQEIFDDLSIKTSLSEPIKEIPPTKPPVVTLDQDIKETTPFSVSAVSEQKVKQSWESLMASASPANEEQQITDEVEEISVKEVCPEYVAKTGSDDFFYEKNIDEVKVAPQMSRIDESTIDHDVVPDVVAALSQIEDKEESKFQPAVSSLSIEDITEDPESSEFMNDVSPSSQNIDEYDDFDDITNISDIKVVNDAEDNDVIMVDFDEERVDLAQKFRQKLRERRSKKVRVLN